MTRSPDALERRRHRQTRHRACTLKRRYNRTDAQARAVELDTPGDPRGPTRAYRCPFCHSWHVGHVPSLYRLQRLAAAIRYYAGNSPPLKPTPPPGEPRP